MKNYSFRFAEAYFSIFLYKFEKSITV